MIPETVPVLVLALVVGCALGVLWAWLGGVL